MSEEEKKAIVQLQHFGNMTEYWKQKEYTSNEIDNYIKVVLNLIDRQQKEIEEKRTTINKMAKDISIQLKELEKLKNEKVINIIENQQKEIIQRDMLLDMYQNNYISKDKIKEKIKELSKTQAYKVGLEEYTIKILNELLEE